jgi:hypothetical protein
MILFLQRTIKSNSLGSFHKFKLAAVTKFDTSSLPPVLALSLPDREALWRKVRRMQGWQQLRGQQEFTQIQTLDIWWGLTLQLPLIFVLLLGGLIETLNSC